MSIVFRYLIRNKFKSIYFFLLAIPVVAYQLFDTWYPLQVKRSYSKVIYARDSTLLSSFLTSDDKWRLKAELYEINDQLKEAFIQKEDKYFYQHFGINPIAIGRAMFNNLTTGRRTSGASTLSMQVARMLEPKSRSWKNKVTEMFRAIQLESQYSKEEILQLYLNWVPYGGNIEGVKSAALIYFQKKPEQLSPAEITTLTIIPNRPTSFRIGDDNTVLINNRNKWLKRFEREDIFNTNEVELGIAEPLLAKRNKVPSHAPHFCRKMKYHSLSNDNVYTTLDRHIQHHVENIASNYSSKIKKYNINNVAVLVLDNRTGQVVGYLGSQKFTDDENSGQVDGVQAIRSPGSTLKPLIYAMAIDKGLVTPKTMLNDVPLDFKDYSPLNFNRKFNGKIKVEEALAFSLNVPAVKLLDEVGVSPFVKKLSAIGFKQIKQDQYKLGLSVVLGGCGVRLEELAGMYSAIANNGMYRKLDYSLHSGDQSNQIRFISEESAYLISKILTKPTRPDFPHNYQSSYHIPKVAWKTGTSYGRRDAWSIGYNKNYTVAVWAGNFSGEGVRELTGATIATPLMFEIFNTIDYNTPDNWFKEPDNISFRYVCAETGLVPNHFCENQVLDDYIPNISSTKKCEHLKEVMVSHDDQFSYCTACVPSSGYKQQLFPNYNAEYLSYLNMEQIGYKKIPEHYPSCTRVFHHHQPKIVSPLDGQEYILDRKDPALILLRAQVNNDVKKVYWYINDVFFKEADAQEDVFYKPVLGHTKISCSDDKGRNSNCFIKVDWE